MSRLFKKILCPVDFDDNSMAALEVAIALARENDAHLYLLHVVFAPVGAPGFPVEPYPVVADEPGKQQLEEIARKRLKGKDRWEAIVKVGKPAEVINQTAEDLDVDVIVMATHGRSGMARLFLGSVAEHVVRGAARPVLTIRPADGTAQGASPSAA